MSRHDNLNIPERSENTSVKAKGSKRALSKRTDKRARKVKALLDGLEKWLKAAGAPPETLGATANHLKRQGIAQVPIAALKTCPWCDTGPCLIIKGTNRQGTNQNIAWCCRGPAPEELPNTLPGKLLVQKDKLRRVGP